MNPTYQPVPEINEPLRCVGGPCSGQTQNYKGDTYVRVIEDPKGIDLPDFSNKSVYNEIPELQHHLYKIEQFCWVGENGIRQNVFYWRYEKMNPLEAIVHLLKRHR